MHVKISFYEELQRNLLGEGKENFKKHWAERSSNSDSDTVWPFAWSLSPLDMIFSSLYRATVSLKITPAFDLMIVKYHSIL